MRRAYRSASLAYSLLSFQYRERMCSPGISTGYATSPWTMPSRRRFSRPSTNQQEAPIPGKEGRGSLVLTVNPPTWTGSMAALIYREDMPWC